MTGIDHFEVEREAAATIRGYLYELGTGILAGLAAKLGAWVTAGGVDVFIGI